MRRSPAAADAQHGAPVSPDLDATVACPRCGLAAVWGQLVRMKVLEGAALDSHLAVRPEGWFVDVRACARCGGSLARKVRSPRTHGDTA